MVYSTVQQKQQLTLNSLNLHAQQEQNHHCRTDLIFGYTDASLLGV